MAILAFDIGGSFIKFGVWNNESLENKGQIKTPDEWDIMKEELVTIQKKLGKLYSFEGVAFSVPGSANPEKRIIDGESLVPYLHYFPIYDELEEAFQLPVSFENDANCAALAEVWKGSAQENSNILFVVLGTGIGGTIIVNQSIVSGANRYAGEIGFILLEGEKNFGELATAVSMAKRYANRKDLDPKEIEGKEVFELANQGDFIAQEEVDTFFHYLATGLYNLNAILNPEKIVIGGGVSSLENFKQRITLELEKLSKKITPYPYQPQIEMSTFKNDANLIGAVYHFLNNI